MATLLASYEATRNAVWYMSYATGFRRGLSQSFKPSQSYKITEAQWSGANAGMASGNFVAKLYSHTGTYGSSGTPSTLLATSDQVSYASIVDYNFISFPFSGAQQYVMTSGTAYFISIEYLGTDTSYMVIGDVSTGGYEGNAATKTTGAWQADSCDFRFRIYGDPATPASAIKTINGLAKASVKTYNGLAIASVKTINGLA
jgi:hypothetical protein